ncbi:asparagine synthase (glutamine-hydrolyzing) [Kribbella speibonae]|uniref:asparagine synthase (glutamine-hydrolyzing) n=1 Tax=Kribbella speibonae TaxID=1572660 RepID=A0A4R0J4T6_9ACTN|nr:asparagine synthase (glutamine-hydrolyzing) [Kribbella speibonae]TCC36295.1 asparagine synthase (glutamine-hydrolyzing) [Kribbella speibonae]
MCGIAGFTGPQRPGDLERLAVMAGQMIHRGPDSEGRYESLVGSVVVRRLAVRGGPAADQPLLSEDGSIAVCGNGEIYNYPELRRDLSSRGHSFRSTSDLEVIVHLYEEYGAGLWSELVGDFAVVVIDNRSGSVVLARDRLGIRPLYVTQIRGRLAYCSEIRPLLAVDPEPAAACTAGIAHYLRHQFIPAPLTGFDGIYKVNPGTCLEIRDGQVDEHRYWSLPEDPGDLSCATDLDTGLAGLLADSVGAQGSTVDGPTGLCLSGGLDSAVVAAVHCATAERPLTAFTIDFATAEDRAHSEVTAAAAVASRLGLEHVAVELSADSYLEAATRTVESLEEPICDPTAALLDRIAAEAARRGIRVLLFGDGADELYGGYSQYRRSTAGDRSWTGGRRLLKALDDGSLWPQRLRLPGDGPTELPLTRLLGRSDSEVAEVMCSAAVTDEPRGTRSALLYRYGRDDLRGFVPSTLLARGDKICMAHSVEGRYPYLDHRVVEHGLSLPADRKLSTDSNKVALRSLALDLGIPAAARAAKSPFSLPMAAWLAGPLRGVVAELRLLAEKDQLGLEPDNWLPTLITSDNRLAPGVFPSDVWSIYSLLTWGNVFLP